MKNNKLSLSLLFILLTVAFTALANYTNSAVKVFSMSTNNQNSMKSAVAQYLMLNNAGNCYNCYYHVEVVLVPSGQRTYFEYDDQINNDTADLIELLLEDSDFEQYKQGYILQEIQEEIPHILAQLYNNHLNGVESYVMDYFSASSGTAYLKNVTCSACVTSITDIPASEILDLDLGETTIP